MMVGLADFIRTHHARLVREWEEGAQKNVSSRGLTRPDLANLIPRFLWELGEPDGPELSGEQQRLIESHLSHRLRQGFELSEVVFEFSLLGRLLAALLDEQPAADRPSALEVTRAFAKLSHAIVAASKIFNEQLLED